MNDIVLENERFRLVLGENCTAKSLIVKASGEECLDTGLVLPFFSVTQERPFNNEIKLAYPNCRTTYPANAVRREGDRLIVGFELAPYEAVIRVETGRGYMVFRPDGFRVPEQAYEGLSMGVPPVAELRLTQIPLRKRTDFGEWLNVVRDDIAAIAVLGISPNTRIGHARSGDTFVLTGDAVRGFRMMDAGAALIADAPQCLMDNIDELEKAYGLPNGVESRRSDLINASVYWSADINPKNVDTHIRLAKQGGFRLMLLYYTCICREGDGYSLCGNYDPREEYPRGLEDVAAMVRRIREAGIVPGLHVLHTHIGLRSRYIAPEADHRLNLTERYTLARAVSESDTELETEYIPDVFQLPKERRVLRFGGELIAYESCTTRAPYRFTGCVRGAFGTQPCAHPMGEIGGLLDISEFGATSTYLDQNTSLADEIAGKIAGIYNTGFGFIYFDGSEGTNAPYGYHIPNAQYRVWKKLDPPPIFCEGAAKAHFSWHFLSGGNAFDIFPPEMFKEKIDRHPMEEAPRMRRDYTRVNFGWWGLWNPGTQPDHFEYGTSRAAGWDCPVTIQMDIGKLLSHPRKDDLLEVLRRWEDVRARKLLTGEQKRMLRTPGQEHVLLLNGDGEYELYPTRTIEVCGILRLQMVRRNNMTLVRYWHTRGEDRILLPLSNEKFELRDTPDGVSIPVESKENGSVIPVGKMRYLVSSIAEEKLMEAFRSAVEV